MPYFLLSTLAFVVLVLGTAIYLTRARWLPLVDDLLPASPEHLYARLPTTVQTTFFRSSAGSTFAADAAAGLSSASFDLGGNVETGDGRAGLDDAAKHAILRIMQRRRLPFDAARRVYLEQRFSAHNIAPDGRPRDPKFVSFS